MIAAWCLARPTKRNAEDERFPGDCAVGLVDVVVKIRARDAGT